VNVMEEQREVRAVAKWVRVSPRKARQVVDHIRGRSVPEARTVLAFTDRAAAVEVDKVLRSAIANAEANHGLTGDELVVSGAFVDEGVTIKRWRPQARGRAHPIKKRTCHITIKLASADGAAIPPPVAPPPPAPAPEVEPEAVEEEAPAAEEAPGELEAEEGVEEPRAEAVVEEPQAEEKPKRKRAPRVRKKKEEEG
jgi:large subunit ribosomal protein L22